MEVKYYEVDISKHTKKGKQNETSMCMLGVKEPTAEEALRFLARDVIFLYKCDHVDAVREISQEEAYSAYCMDDIEETLPVFGMKKKNNKCYFCETSEGVTELLYVFESAEGKNVPIQVPVCKACKSKYESTFPRH